MSTPVNYYLYVARGKLDAALGSTVTTSTSTGGTNGDIEVRIQIDNGTTTTGVTKFDVMRALESIGFYIQSNGIQSGSPGTNLPAK